jgi:hypothetical protein
MKSIEVRLHKTSYWQLVFLQSKVNGAAYNGEKLPGQHWDWPKNTYLQRRLRRQSYLAPVGNPNSISMLQGGNETFAGLH